MDWRSAHREAMAAAFALHEDLGIDTFGRIDVFEAITSLGLRLTFRPLVSAAGLYIPPRKGLPGVIVNSDHPLAMQRYSAAHELGHHSFGHGAQVFEGGEVGQRRATTPHERLAEAFAAWFLMPPEGAEAALLRLGLERPESAGDAYALSLRLGVSFRALCTHIPSLRLASSAIAEQWRQRPLKSVKEEILAEPPPGGWQNDIWILRLADAENDIVVRCGDRLLVDLPGFEIESAPAGSDLCEAFSPELFQEPRCGIDLPSAMDPQPGRLVLRSSTEEVGFSIKLERPRLGRYVGSGPVRA